MSWLKEGFYYLLPKNYSTLEAEKLEKLEKQVRPTLLLCFWAGMLLCFSDKCLLNFIFSVSFSLYHTHSDTLISNCFCHLLHWEYFPRTLISLFAQYFILQLDREAVQESVWRVQALEPDGWGVNQLFSLPAMGSSFSSCVASVFFCKLRITNLQSSCES